MSGRKRNHESAFKPPKKRKIIERQTIKRSARKGLKKNRDMKTDEFARLIDIYVLEMTRCFILGTLNIHYDTNDRFKNDTEKEIEKFYSQFVNKNFFRNWFFGVKFIEHAFNDARKSGYTLCYGVWYYCQKYGVRAPLIESFGNVVEYAAQMFYTNYKNNICMHARSRIRKFFTHQNKSKAHIDDTIDYLFKENSDCVPDLDLMWELEHTLRPIRFGDGKGYFFAMKENWFKYVPIFLNLQR